MIASSDIAELRKLFPVIEHWIYLYNGSIHACPLPVSEAMRAYLREWEEGGEAAFFGAYDAFAALKEEMGALLHCPARNIAITESTTAGINTAVQIIEPRNWQNVVATDIDYMSNTYPWMVTSFARAAMRFVNNRDGAIDMADLASAIDANTAALSLCVVTPGSGFRYDLAKVRAIAGSNGIPVVADAAQAAGLIEIDLGRTPLDFMAGTFSKWLMGPAGIGYLYVSDRFLGAKPPSAGWLAATNVGAWDVRHCELAEDAMRFQGGIPNLVGVAGALAAVRLLKQIGREFIEARVRELTGYTLDRLEELGVDIWTPRADDRRAGIVFFRTPGCDELHGALKARRIYCGHFLDGIRIDPTFYNTIEEIDRFLEIVATHVKARGK